MRRGTLSRFHLVTALAVVLCVVVPQWWLVVGGYVPVVALGVTFPQLQFFGASLCRVRTGRKAVALTFDDGPDPMVTPVLLDLLKQRGVQATFFCTGQRVEEHPDVARRIMAEGHLMANHSFAHSHGTNVFTARRLREDLARAQEAIARVTGELPKLFRPPMGLTNLRVFRVATELGLTVVGWTVRGLDTRQSAPIKIAGRITRRLRPGAIIVLHDGGVTNCVVVPAVELLLDELDRQGYRAERLDELMETK
jgi:peptidoglycan/xylan/chitin deacetylase (PgdA/CDA1 family)